MSLQYSGFHLKIGFVSLGCPKNLVDSEVMLGTLARQGYSITANKEDADIIVVNTCGFIDTAKKESIDTILETLELKKSGKVGKVVVAGCLAQRYGIELAKEIPEVDAFLGTGQMGQVPALVRRLQSGKDGNWGIGKLSNGADVSQFPNHLI